MRANQPQPPARDNAAWLRDLKANGDPQAAALADLRDLLLRAALYTLLARAVDLRGLAEHDRTAFAEDCAQEALQAVLAHLGDFRGESKFTTWAYKFGVNIALTRARRAGWRDISLEALADADDALDWLAWKELPHSDGPEDPALREEVGELIRAAVREELSDRQRQVLKWIAFDDVPMDVVVERLETNRNAIYKMLHDARLKIKRRLAERGYPVEDIYELFQSDWTGR